MLGDVASEQVGAASGMLQAVRQLGGAVGLVVIASVYTSPAAPEQFVPGFGLVLLT